MYDAFAVARMGVFVMAVLALVCLWLYGDHRRSRKIQALAAVLFVAVFCISMALGVGGVMPRVIWGIELTRKRRAGQPIELVSVHQGDQLSADFCAQTWATREKVPSTWVRAVPYVRSERAKGKRNGR